MKTKLHTVYYVIKCVILLLLVSVTVTLYVLSLDQYFLGTWSTFLQIMRVVIILFAYLVLGEALIFELTATPLNWNPVSVKVTWSSGLLCRWLKTCHNLWRLIYYKYAPHLCF